MDPRDDSDEDDPAGDDSDETEPIIRELRAELLRLEAQLDQILAGEREHGEDVAKLETEMRDLQGRMGAIRARYQRDARRWGWTGFFYGITIGLWAGWLLRKWLA
jgi:hypothetical protein